MFSPIFRFPEAFDQGLQTVLSKEDLKNKLCNAFKLTFPDYSNRAYGFRITLDLNPSHSYLMASCSHNIQGCRWKLNYKKCGYFKKQNGEYTMENDKQCYRIKKMNLMHDHSPLFLKMEYPVSTYIRQLNERQRIICETMTAASISHKEALQYLASIDRPVSYFCKFSIKSLLDGQISKKMSFYQFYQNYCEKLEFITPTQYQNNPQCIDKIPDFIVFTDKTSRQLCKEREEVVGIKIMKKQISERSSKYYEFSIALFYQISFKGKMIVFMTAVYAQDENVIKKISNKQKTYRVNFGLLKSILVFKKAMNKKLKIIIVDDLLQQIETVQYFTKVYSNTKQKITYLVNPRNFIQKNVPQEYLQVAKRLLSSSSYKQYEQRYFQALQDQKFAKTLQKIHYYRQKFFWFTKQHDYPLTFIKTWIQKLQWKYFQFERCLQMPLAYNLYQIYRVLQKQHLTKYPKVFTTANTFDERIESIKVSKFYDWNWIEPLRVIIQREPFRVMMAEIHRSFKLSFTYGVNAQEIFKRFRAHIESLGCKATQDKQFQVSIKLQQIVDEYKKTHQKNNQDSQFKAQSFNEMYQQIESINSKNNRSDDDYNTIFRQNKDLISRIQVQNKSFDQIRYKKYNELYPIVPATNIKLQNSIPFVFQIEQNGQTYFCIRQSEKSKDGRNVNKHPKFICSCGLLRVEGVPCRHLIKVCTRFQLPVQDYISKYWKLRTNYNQRRQSHYQKQGLQVPTVGKPKLTRQRNRNNH